MPFIRTTQGVKGPFSKERLAALHSAGRLPPEAEWSNSAEGPWRKVPPIKQPRPVPNTASCDRADDSREYRRSSLVARWIVPSVFVVVLGVCVLTVELAFPGTLLRLRKPDSLSSPAPVHVSEAVDSRSGSSDAKTDVETDVVAQSSHASPKGPQSPSTLDADKASQQRSIEPSDPPELDQVISDAEASRLRNRLQSLPHLEPSDYRIATSLCTQIFAPGDGSLSRISSSEQAQLHAVFSHFSQPPSASDFYAGAENNSAISMKAFARGQVVSIGLPTDTETVVSQFLDQTVSYEPDYRQALGEVMLAVGSRRFKQLLERNEVGDTKKSESVWAGLVERLQLLQEFLCKRDLLIMHPIADRGTPVFTPALLPVLQGSVISPLQQALAENGLPEASVDLRRILRRNRYRPADAVKTLEEAIRDGIHLPNDPGAYRIRDRVNGVREQLASHIRELAPSPPVVLAEEGYRLWLDLRELSEVSSTTYRIVCRSVDEESQAELMNLVEIYDSDSMPSAQQDSTWYGVAVAINKKVGVNNSVLAIERGQ